MTTEIPTSNPAAGVAGFFPEGLPDEASLSELASQFFRLLPGTSLPQVPAAVASPPVALEDVPAAPVNSPRVLPSSAAPNGAPDVLAQSVPAYGLPAGGEALSVPEAAAPQLPHAGHAPYSPPGTPYYFLGEAAGLAPPGTPAGTTAEPRAFGPPGEQELAALLAELTLSSPPQASAAPGTAHPGASGQDF